MKPVVKYSLYAVGAVVALLAVFTFAAGPIARGVINGSGPSLIGRQIHVDDVSVNFFTGSLQIDSLCVAEADGETPFLSVSQFRARLSVPRLLFGTYSLHDVDVAGMRLNIEQRDTVFNFSDILAFLGEEEDEEPLPLVMHDINLHHSHVHYQDLLVHSDFRISDFSLFIPGIDLRDINTSVGVQLALGDDCQLTTNVDYDDRRQTYKVDLELTNFDLESVLPYMQQQMMVDELRGILNLNLEVAGSLQHMLDFKLKGMADVHHFSIVDPYGESLISCDSIAIGVRDVDLTQARVELSRMVFDQPFINISYGKDSLDNFSRLMLMAAMQQGNADAPAADDAAADAAVSFNGKEKDLRLIIDHLAIQGAKVNYLDESLIAEPFEYQLHDVNFTANRFTLDGVNHLTGNARLGSEGRLDFRYDGRLTDQHNMSLTLMADRIDFSDFSPYTLQMFGNEVSSGTLSINMLAKTVNGNLLGQNHIVLRDPKVEKKRRGLSPEMNVPFRQGLYILTDRNNVIDIELPVNGNVDEPRFSFKRVIFRTLAKLIVKVATSPFRRHQSPTGDELSLDELLQLDDRSLDAIDIDSISSDILVDE